MPPQPRTSPHITGIQHPCQRAPSQAHGEDEREEAQRERAEVLVERERLREEREELERLRREVGVGRGQLEEQPTGLFQEQGAVMAKETHG